MISSVLARILRSSKLGATVASAAGIRTVADGGGFACRANQQRHQHDRFRRGGAKPHSGTSLIPVLRRGSGRSVCSLGVKPILSKRPDCRSCADGGVHAGGGVAVRRTISGGLVATSGRRLWSGSACWRPGGRRRRFRFGAGLQDGRRPSGRVLPGYEAADLAASRPLEGGMCPVSEGRLGGVAQAGAHHGICWRS